MQTRVIKRHGYAVQVPVICDENIPAIIEYGVKFIREQGRASTNEICTCMYRGKQQACCIAGAFLDDDEVVDKEGKGIGSILKELGISDDLQSPISTTLRALQHTHDSTAKRCAASKENFLTVWEKNVAALPATIESFS